MTEPGRPAPDAAVEAARTLSVLNGQADAVRADLQVLRRDLAQVERNFNASPGVVMRRVNEQLVIAAMRAEAIAEAATARLGEMVRSTMPERDSQLFRRELDHDAKTLREANERLVIAALSSQELEATAVEAHRRQVSFLATVAHELRNPLMPLRLAALMLDRARTDDVAHAKLQATITGQVAQMTRLIGDLLDGSRISTGKFRMERTLIDVCNVIARAIETCQPAMDARHHTFTSSVPPGPIMMLGDTVRLVQVLGNLLENSSKYSPEGSEISMRATVAGGAIVIVISDKGIGISAKALPHVFDMFVRDAQASMTHDGLGIGLAIVRELVRAHEGTVTASSAGEGLGSEFVVRLPLAVVHPAAPVTSPS
ncbi:cell wall metabolism sensor histidine kinase WalK [Caenimonas sp. SL110]|uniref:sensor histidine kinase n=1 Tax=Caenimonas sp. SL110 TaxID=1450524 RepID=UPI000654492E|nr:HAMP domain-containing sensor histidine kinase [Caenimonas sp. SL110]